MYEFVTQNWKPHGGYLSDQISILDGSTGLQRTFHDQYVTTGGLAAALKHNMHVNSSSTVAVFCPNHVEYLPTVLAVSLCGAKITPVNPMYTAMELQVVLEKSWSTVLVVHHTLVNTALEVAKNCSHLKHIIVITDDNDPNPSVPAGTVSFNSLRNHADPFHETPGIVHHHTNQMPVTVPYSSGTTGLPKGVCLTHENIVTNLLQMEQVEGIAYTQHDKVISPLPFYHIYAFTVSMMYTAWKGNTIITMSGRFDFERFCQLIEQHRPVRAHLVPPILLALAKNPIVEKYDLSSLQMIISAAAPLSFDLEMAVEKRLGGCRVKQAWGMSELSPIGTCNSDYDSKRGSVGPLVSSTVGKVVNEEGRSLGPNEPGELFIHGPQVMLGYVDDPEKTAECLSESRWLHTGDVAYYDEDGFFYITDRIKELIKVRGYPVAPAELEALLLTHEAIADAAVVQAHDDHSGEVPRAYVVLNDSEAAKRLTEQDVYEWVKERVAAYKRLDGGVEFTDVIPKSASGKILRRLLRDKLKSQQQTEAK